MTFDPFWIIHLILRLVLKIFDISTLRISLWLFEHHTFQKQKSLSLFPSQILVYTIGFCSSISLFIWRFTFSELFCKNIKLKWEDIWAQIYASIKTIDKSFMTSLKNYLQQTHIVFKISSTQINVHTDTS